MKPQFLGLVEYSSGFIHQRNFQRLCPPCYWHDGEKNRDTAAFSDYAPLLSTCRQHAGNSSDPMIQNTNLVQTNCNQGFLCPLCPLNLEASLSHRPSWAQWAAPILTSKNIYFTVIAALEFVFLQDNKRSAPRCYLRQSSGDFTLDDPPSSMTPPFVSDRLGSDHGFGVPKPWKFSAASGGREKMEVFECKSGDFKDFGGGSSSFGRGSSRSVTHIRKQIANALIAHTLSWLIVNHQPCNPLGWHQPMGM